MSIVTRHFVLRFTAMLAMLASIAAGQSAAPGTLPEPVMWRQDTFLIPYQFSATSDPKTAREVVLYLSKDWGRTWREVTRARPDVRFFTYRAEGDGDYCFAMRTVDQSGASWPAGDPSTELRVIVDTRPPVFQFLQGAIDPQGQLQVQWRVTDEYLDPASLKLEVQADGQADWQPISIAAGHAPAQTESAGKAVGVVPPGARRVLLRATINDKAGNRGTSGSEVLPNSTLPIAPSSTPATTVGFGGWGSVETASRGMTPSSEGLANPFSTAPLQTNPSLPPSQPWPADAHSLIPFAPTLDASSPRVTRLDALRGNPTDPTPPAPTPWMHEPSASPFHQASSSRGGPADPQYTSPTAARATSIPPEARVVNTPHFALDYDVRDAGQWGVAKVELWGTADGGQTWRSFAIDHDNRSPVNVTAPGEGLYGFRIVIEAVGGLTSPPPAPGERPELWVHVDTTRPQAQLVSAKQGEGYFADHLEITWQAQDAHLADRPIGIFYSSRPNGPWSAAATNLDNTGRYVWRLQRHVPSQIYLRIEARDRAGNSGVHQFEQPISLSVPQASGSLRDLHRP